jgi:hemoglobin
MAAVVSGESAAPSLFEWMGGEARLTALFSEFYRRVALDPVIAPVFAAMDEHHAHKVAEFVGQVFGGPASYTGGGGSHAVMIARHMERRLTAEQRVRWVTLLVQTADEVGVPEDPEFRAAFVGYLEWGSRLAVMNSAPGVPEPHADLPMPQWNWGPPGGPWKG